MPDTLGLQPYLENAALEVAETFAVPLSYHNLTTMRRKVLISQMARRQSQSSVKMFGSSASTISTRFRVATEDIFVQRHILQLRSLRQQVKTAWSRQKSQSKFYLTMISRRTPQKRPGRLSIFCLFCLPRGIRIFSRTGYWTSLKLLHLKENSII